MNTKQTQLRPFRLNAIASALLALPLSVSNAYAEQAADGRQNTQNVELESVKVIAKKPATRKDSEITGLGKVVKNSDGLSKEQVLGIRDLTRYDPGIAVVEQGRGASSGYSIRGMDRNRVSLNVDGLPQIQSYTVDDTSASSGAINEIEYENITSIEINKGANSAEQGNGSLGGSLVFRTKEPDDIIGEDRNWGIRTKSTYSSKNKQLANSIAAAGRINGFDGLAVFTHRKGHEIQAHKHAGRHTQIQKRMDGYTEDASNQNGWIVLEGDCADTSNCDKVRQYSKISKSDSRLKTEEVPAAQYTGSNRVLPNPMEYESRSWLFKGGYQIAPRHYLGAVLENTLQRYDIRDMDFEQYWSNTNRSFSEADKSQGVYGYGENINNGLTARQGSSDGWRYIGLGYSRLRYFDEHHKKNRQGLTYRYDNPEKNTWADKLRIGIDRQTITLDTLRHDHYCSVYPTVDKNCRADLNKPWSAYQSERSIYGEQHLLWHINGEKKLSLAGSEHKLSFGIGSDRFQSTLQRKDIYAENMQQDVESVSGDYTRHDPYVYRISNRKIHTFDLCDYSNNISVYNCHTRKIKGWNHYLSLRDHMSLGQYFDWGVGMRYDYHKMTASDSWTSSGSFKNFSWNSGLVFKATPYLSFSHRISDGFRTPSFQELFGYRIDGYEKGKNDNDHYVGKFKSEKALNNEFGIHLKGAFGYLEASYFRNRYKNLIGLTHIDPNIQGLSDGEKARGYRNMYNASTDGINLIGKIDWNGVSEVLPDGLYSTLAYSHVKLKKASLTKPYFQHSCSLLLDTIQPSRYVLGLGYDAPSGKWGVNGMMTYSKAKNPDELQGECRSGITRNTSATKKTTKAWYIFDISGYVNLKDKLTLRGGIYNLANRRYAQWESVRQSAIGAVNRQRSVGDYTRYAAPGRNVTVSLEMKF